MYEAGQSKPVLWDNPEGWSREEGGRGVQDGGTHVHLWLIHVDVWENPPHYCKVISLQLKKKSTGVGSHFLLQRICVTQVFSIEADSLPSELPGKPEGQHGQLLFWGQI